MNQIHKEVRFKAFFMGEESLPIEDPFSLESAHQFLSKKRFNEKDLKRQLKRRRCRIETQYERGLFVNKAGIFSSIVPLWIDYDNIRRFFVFKAEPNVVIVGVNATRDNDGRILSNRLYLFRFDSSDEVGAFCDHIEHRKLAPNQYNYEIVNKTNVPPPSPSLQQQQQSIKPMAETEARVSITNVPPPIAAAATTSSSSSSVKGTTIAAMKTSSPILAIYSQREMQERPIYEDEQIALRRYDEILRGYENNGNVKSIDFVKSSTNQTQQQNQNLAIQSKQHSKSLNVLHNMEEEEEEEEAGENRWELSSSARPTRRGISLEPTNQLTNSNSLLQLNSHRRQPNLLSEDVRFLNYGPEGYYETEDGPIFFYVAHVKADGEEEEEEEEDGEEGYDDEDDDNNVNVNISQFEQEIVNRERRALMMNAAASPSLSMSSSSLQMCEMEVKLDFEDEDDDDVMNYIENDNQQKRWSNQQQGMNSRNNNTMVSTVYLKP